MNIKEFEVKEVSYGFRLTYGAKKEIDKINQKRLEVLNDAEIAKVLPYISKLDDQSISEEEKLITLAKVAPFIQKINTENNDFEPVELGYILLRNTKEHKNMSKSEYEDFIYDLEEQIGFEKMYAEFIELHEQVFTQMGQIEKMAENRIVPQNKKLVS